MEAWITDLLQPLPVLVLFPLILGILFILSKGADILVDEAVSLSIRWGIPKVVVAATIVSLGTTLPEVTVSVTASLAGNPEVALGNAVGSIICNTSLIIGVAALIRTLPVHRTTTDRQSLILLITGGMLVLFTLPWLPTGASISTRTGNISQILGFILLLALFTHLIDTFRRAKSGKLLRDPEASPEEHPDDSPTILILARLALGLVIIILSSKTLLPVVQLTATKLGIPQSIIAATLIAFGTSLPEFMTAIQASRKGHGEIAVGNVIGANILNVLFVIGASAAVSPAGIMVNPVFIIFYLPVMLMVLIYFRFILTRSSGTIGRVPAIVLLLGYIIFTVGGYLII